MCNRNRVCDIKDYIPCNSPWPILPSRPITTRQGSEVTWTRPTHHSQSFWRPSRRAEPFFLLALLEEAKYSVTQTKIQKSQTRKEHFFKHWPVGHVYVNDWSLQQFSVLVGAAGQQPALVMRQTVGHKEDIVFLSCLAKGLTQLCLLVLHWSQDEWWCVEMHKLCPLDDGKKEYSKLIFT